MTKRFDWSKVNREGRLRRGGGETIDGRRFKQVEQTKGVGQQSLHGAGQVSLNLDKHKARAKFFERVCRAIAGEQNMTDLSGLPRSLALEVISAGGAELWVLAEPGARSRIERLKFCIKNRAR